MVPARRSYAVRRAAAVRQYAAVLPAPLRRRVLPQAPHRRRGAGVVSEVRPGGPGGKAGADRAEPPAGGAYHQEGVKRKERFLAVRDRLCFAGRAKW